MVGICLQCWRLKFNPGVRKIPGYFAKKIFSSYAVKASLLQWWSAVKTRVLACKLNAGDPLILLGDLLVSSKKSWGMTPCNELKSQPTINPGPKGNEGSSGASGRCSGHEGWGSHEDRKRLNQRAFSPSSLQRPSRIQPSRSQEVGSHQTNNLLAHWPWTSQPPECVCWCSVVFDSLRSHGL